jgi:hypothetical protein
VLVVQRGLSYLPLGISSRKTTIQTEPDEGITEMPPRELPGSASGTYIPGSVEILNR